jgi:hypothetical protein
VWASGLKTETLSLRNIDIYLQVCTLEPITNSVSYILDVTKLHTEDNIGRASSSIGFHYIAGETLGGMVSNFQRQPEQTVVTGGEGE